MANPSLQIGNSNWAIKKDNLLGYSTAGTRFLPIPITMTRASAGTRVNPQGLVETVELLGSEEIIDGGFPNGSNDWSEIDGGTITNNEMVLDCGGNTNAYTFQSKATSYTSGKTYKLTVKVASNTTGVNLILYPFSNSPNTSVINIGETAGTYTIYFVADYTSGTGKTFVLRALSSTGTLTIDNVSVKESTRNDLARVDYTGSTSSLLAEPQRTNLITHSETFSDSSWTKLGAGTGSTAVVTSDYAISPDGTQNATRLVCDLNGGGGSVSNQSLIYDLYSSSGDQSLSIYVKSNTGSNQTIYFANTQTSGDTIIATNEWQRFTFSHSTTNYVFAVGLRGRTGGAIDDTADILIWGGQAESGSFPTSYIPTSGSTVTRNQDQFSRDGIGSLIGQTEGTFFIELSKPVLNFSTQSLISLNNAASNSDANSIAIGFDTGDDFFIRLQSNNVLVFQETETNADANTFYKVAISYKSGESLMYLNGSPLTPTSGNLSNAFTFAVILDNLSFDFRGDGALPFFGKVKQLQVYKTALTDTQLAALTS